tara:strand:+ start:1177 stop:1731 length:555 start_codon:yes stop_codon:yes gene_type:complete
MALENIQQSETPHSAPPMDEFQIAGILKELIKAGLKRIPEDTVLHHGSRPPNLLERLHNESPLFMTDKEGASEYSGMNGDSPVVDALSLSEGRVFDIEKAHELGMIDRKSGALTPFGAEFADEAPWGSLDYNWQDMVYSPEFRRLLDQEEYKYLLEPKGQFFEDDMPELISLFPERDLRLRGRR